MTQRSFRPLPCTCWPNLAVGGDWPGAPDETTVFPAFMDIDYIRVWKRQDSLHPGDIWRFHRGSSAPHEDWLLPGFDDAAWEAGPSGFGYGGRDDATVLSDMAGNYGSVFIRREFNVTDPDALTLFGLSLDFAGGFVAYINGTEVARANVDGSPPEYNARADAPRRPSRGDGSVPTFDLMDVRDLLEPGTNVIAIQGHNHRVNSSDYSLVPTLMLGTTADSPPRTLIGCPALPGDDQSL